MNIEIKENLEKFYDENVWEHMTLGEFITNCAKNYKDKIAIVDGDMRLFTKIFTICFNIIIKTPISIISMFSVFFTKISFNLNSVIKTIISYTHESRKSSSASHDPLLRLLKIKTVRRPDPQ